MKTRVSTSIFAGTFLLSSSVLLLENTLTRIMSVLNWHHFTYMIISVALLGFGAAGSYMTFRKSRSGYTLDAGRISRYIFLYALATVLAVLVVTQIYFKSWDAMLAIIIYYALLLVPFFFAGLSLGSIFALYSGDINRIYAADLIGASSGSLLSVAAIGYLGATNTVLLVALMGAIAAWLLQVTLPVRKLALAAIPAVILLGTLVAGIVVDPFLVYPPSNKEMTPYVNPQVGSSMVDLSKWHVIARIDILKPIEDLVGPFGGEIRKVYSQPWSQRNIYQDGAAPTAILQSNGNVKEMPFLPHYLQALPYQVEKNPNVLVIGIGGGIDALIALYHDASHVTGVDINPITVRAITQTYKDYTSGIFTGPNIDIVTAEGRHFLSRDKNQYDVIQLSGVDTFSALSSGSYALAENYLYTVEAMRDYWDHLTPKGVLSFSRWNFTPPRESLRLVTMMAEAMESRGVTDPAQHIVVVEGFFWVETLMKKEPFTSQEVEQIGAWTIENGFMLKYDPFTAGDSEYSQVLHTDAAGREAFYRQYTYNVRPATDDRPFFFDYYKWNNLFTVPVSEQGYTVTRMPLGLLTLLMNLIQIVILGAIGILGPLRLLRKGSFSQSGSWPALAYFCALGLGYIFVEISLIQKFSVLLGGPTYTFSISVFSMLLFSGLGSFVARRWDLQHGRTLTVLTIAVVGLILLINLALPLVVSSLLGVGMFWRALVTILVIAPLAFVMGMPFPLGIKLLDHARPEWIPWAWASNSFLSVLGTALATLLSMQLGLRWVFFLASLVYLGGFLSMGRLVRRTAAEAHPETAVRTQEQGLA